MNTLPPGADAFRVINKTQTAELLGLSVATVDRLDRAGKLPPAIQLSERRKGWSLAAIQQWQTCRMKGVA